MAGEKPPPKGKQEKPDASSLDTSSFGPLPPKGRNSGPFPQPKQPGPVPQRHPTGNVRVSTAPSPKVQASGPHPNPLAKTPTGQVPVVGQPGAPAVPGAAVPKAQTTFQKQQLVSGFTTDERQKRLNSVIGNTGELTNDVDEEEEPTTLGLMFDGETPAPQLAGRDVWKAVQAPVQSREGRRSVEMLTAVLAQFAVGNNPRYDPDGPGRPRGHIFLWDISRAMNCEVPHFVGAKELSLAQTVDWVRHEGPMRGWVRGGPEEALNAAQQGMLAVAMPKDIKLKQLAIVLPEDPDPNGKPRVAAAALKKGSNLALNEALGVFLAEYFIHA